MSEVNRIKARVLVGTIINGIGVAANDLVEASEELIIEYQKSGALDTSKGAVQYCIDNKVDVIDLEPVEVPDVVTDQMIVEAILALDPENKAFWTKTGKPQTEAIAEQIGFGVTIKAADRDAAWKIIQEEADEA